MESELHSTRSHRSASLASTSSLSATSTVESDSLALDQGRQDDDDVMAAIQALGILRHSNSTSMPASSSVSSNWSQSIPGTNSSTGASSPALSEIGVEREDPKKFISRVSALSLVSGGLEWYERSKSSSKVVKVSLATVSQAISLINSLTF